MQGNVWEPMLINHFGCVFKWFSHGFRIQHFHLKLMSSTFQILWLILSVGLETFWSELKLNYPIVFCHLEELKSSESLFWVARDDFEKLLSRHFCVQLSGIMFRHVFSHCHTVYSNTQHNQQKISPRAFYWTRDGLLFSHVIHFIDLNFLAAHIHSQK